jgi:hypothetical protein
VGFIGFGELSPVTRILNVLFLTRALFLQADENKDGRLTLDEMLNHPYIFYSTAYDEDEFDYSQHDEFR